MFHLAHFANFFGHTIVAFSCYALFVFSFARSHNDNLKYSTKTFLGGLQVVYVAHQPPMILLGYQLYPNYSSILLIKIRARARLFFIVYGARAPSSGPRPGPSPNPEHFVGSSSVYIHSPVGEVQTPRGSEVIYTNAITFR